MNQELELKRSLHQKCIELIDQRIATINQMLNDVLESRNNETKSSVGDKHETGRAIMQLEEEKYRAQLRDALQVRNQLNQIDVEKKSTKVRQGSLVRTDHGVYFITIGIGKITYDGQSYFCISTLSPIGQRLIDKKTGDVVEFNHKKITIGQVY